MFSISIPLTSDKNFLFRMYTQSIYFPHVFHIEYSHDLHMINLLDSVNFKSGLSDSHLL